MQSYWSGAAVEAMRKSLSRTLSESLSTARVFGIPLEEVQQSGQPGHEVPLLVRTIVEYIEEHGEWELASRFNIKCGVLQEIYREIQVQWICKLETPPDPSTGKLHCLYLHVRTQLAYLFYDIRHMFSSISDEIFYLSHVS